MTILCRSGTEEEYGERERLLQEARELYDSGRKRSDESKAGRKRQAEAIRKRAIGTLKGKLMRMSVLG